MPHVRIKSPGIGLGRKTESGLDQVVLGTNIVTPVTEAFFQAQAVNRVQADVSNIKLRTGLLQFSKDSLIVSPAGTKISQPNSPT